MIKNNNFMIKYNNREFKDLFINYCGKNPTIYPVFDGSVIYKSINEHIVPSLSGVYFIHDFRGFLYIGETNNLRKRFKQHLNVETNKNLINLLENPFGEVKFFWIDTETKMLAVKLQKYWIRELKPFSNYIKYKTNNRSN